MSMSFLSVESASQKYSRLNARIHYRPGDKLADRIRDRTATIGVMGLGYVGLPLVNVIADAGFRVIGFDIDTEKVEKLKRGDSYISQFPGERFRALFESELFLPTSDLTRASEADAILVCVPTPLTRHREPDLTFVISTAEAIAEHLRPDQLIILESTSYPGTTCEVVRPILEATGLKSGRDFYLAFSPEREDPGNTKYGTKSIPKVIGGDGPEALMLAQALYDQFVDRTIPVSNPDTAEAVKITENVFRAVNVALANELKTIYAAMGIDIWEVIEAAKTKPFGFMAFYPGPGLGGHCIPIDPFYLTWRAREFGLTTRFVELAGEINSAMPEAVVNRLAYELDHQFAKGLKGSRILLVGLAYKKNVGDTRGSPGFRLIEVMEARGAMVDYFDPFVPTIGVTHEHADLAGRQSIVFTRKAITDYDAVLIATDHDGVDYRTLAENAKLIVDTRNVIARAGLPNTNVVKA